MTATSVFQPTQRMTTSQVLVCLTSDDRVCLRPRRADDDECYECLLAARRDSANSTDRDTRGMERRQHSHSYNERCPHLPLRTSYDAGIGMSRRGPVRRRQFTARQILLLPVLVLLLLGR